ncbi:MAG: hypothetical protein PHO66_02410, partial [Eubacteriales bacterium]|nr:hypothetical protein [Eubacteriales bacterium]
MKNKAGYLSIALCTLLMLSACAPPGAVQPTHGVLPGATASPAPANDALNASGQFLLDYGIIKDGQYAADGIVTRTTAARLVADVTGLTPLARDDGYTHPFVDVTGEDTPVIALLYQHNIITGVSDNRFIGDGVCDANTFLLFLLRAMDHVGGRQSDVTWENAGDMARRRGLRDADWVDDGRLSMDDAFDICYAALSAGIDDAGQTLLDYLSVLGVVSIAGAAGYDGAYQITAPLGEPFYYEDFNDKKLENYDVKAANGSVAWQGSRTKGALNEITADGYLQLSGKEQELAGDQQVALRKDLMQNHESYGMTFTVNVQSMANEGDANRVILRIIARTADAAFTNYYAINYYMVLPIGEYQSNLARCMWSITNTNAPSGTAPLAQASYLLKEGVDYTARLLVEDTPAGGVHIAFYIDGPDRAGNGAQPLLEMTDDTPYKITRSAAGPAFGTSGYQGAGWGYASTVRFDDVALYDTQSFATQTKQLAAFADTPLTVAQDDEYATQTAYLVRRGVLMPHQRSLTFGGNVSVAQFLATALYATGRHMQAGQTLETFVLADYQRIFAGTPAADKADLNRGITRYEAARIIAATLPGLPGDSRYRALYQDTLDSAYESAVFFAVQNGYLPLDGNNCFGGAQALSRQDVIRIFCCAADARLRQGNHALQLPSVFSRDAVLQGGKPLPITGYGMTGDTVTVTFNGQTKTAKVVDGQWAVELDRQAYGGPHTLSVKDSGYQLSFPGIYVGEVFVVTGQSNAEMSVYE